jgi:2-polyprenyl-6-methoxyphenol hydroxylase-like FAD-dependent oxidoreductase
MSVREADGSHAVVIGGSIAGLLAARALTGHFERITVVERDHLPDRAEFRPGTPQSRHIHVLLARGAQLLEQMFPGLSDELIAAGAISSEWPADVLALGRSGWTSRFSGGLRLLSFTHNLLEWALRRRLSTMAGTCFIMRNACIGLLSSRDSVRILGVRLRPRAGAGPEAKLAADLVVDATGRDSHAPVWLEALGYEAPRESRIDSLLGYSSRFYAPPPGLTADWKAIYLRGRFPENARGGVLMPVEGGRWLVTLTGIGTDCPPTDEAGFLEFARSLRSPVLYDAISEAEPLTPVRGFRRTDNRLRHYEELRRLPQRFVLLGDAVCAFNPVYGQGMTVAALGATVLDACLREQRRHARPDDLTGLASRFQRRLARANATAWLVATGEDLRYPTTSGARARLRTRLQHRYLDRVLDVALENARVNLASQRVLHMLAPPASLLHPAVAIPALRGRRQPALVAPPVAPP